MTYKDFTTEDWERKLGKLPSRHELQVDTDLRFAYGSIDRELWDLLTKALSTDNWRAQYQELNEKN